MQVEFELVNHDVVVQHVSYYATESPPFEL